jgi:hypothetical protein
MVVSMRSLMDPIYRAIESGDLESFGSQLRPDVFMFTPEAEGVFLSRAEVISFAAEKVGLIRSVPGGIRLEAEPVTSGEDSGGRAAWVFDLVSIWVGEPDSVLPTRVRVTALLTREADGWRVAACYWSLPFVTQAEQDAVKHAGLLDPGLPVPESGGAPVAPYVAALIQAFDEPRLLPGLYSTRQDHATIGSVVDEVFLGPAGRAAWQEFVGFVSSFTLRGRCAPPRSPKTWDGSRRTSISGNHRRPIGSSTSGCVRASIGASPSPTTPYLEGSMQRPSADGRYCVTALWPPWRREG